MKCGYLCGLEMISYYVTYSAGLYLDAKCPGLQGDLAAMLINTLAASLQRKSLPLSGGLLLRSLVQQSLPQLQLQQLQQFHTMVFKPHRALPLGESGDVWHTLAKICTYRDWMGSRVTNSPQELSLSPSICFTSTSQISFYLITNLSANFAGANFFFPV